MAELALFSVLPHICGLCESASAVGGDCDTGRWRYCWLEHTAGEICLSECACPCHAPRPGRRAHA